MHDNERRDMTRHKLHTLLVLKIKNKYSSVYICSLSCLEEEVETVALRNVAHGTGKIIYSMCNITLNE